MGRLGSTAVACIAAIAFGCGTARPSASTASAPRSSAMPVAPGGSAARPSPAPPIVQPEPVPKPGPPLRVIDEFEREPVLHVLGDVVFVSIEQQLRWIHPEHISADPSLIEGLPKPGGLWSIAHVAGKWPDS